MRVKKLLLMLGMVGMLAAGTAGPASASAESICYGIDEETGKYYIGFWNCV